MEHYNSEAPPNHSRLRVWVSGCREEGALLGKKGHGEGQDETLQPRGAPNAGAGGLG